jgi:cytochrome oxidase Cu insertion factor (SCO1/SenC/PrrC family)
MHPNVVVLLTAIGTSLAEPAWPLGIFEPAPHLSGTVIEHPTTAPDFTLTDQDGIAFRMANARGKVVVMSFLYTHCTDLCPFVAVKLKTARDALGADARKAVFVVVTTDPERDTQNVLADYTRSVGLAHAWHFLTGPLAAVRAVWFGYGVGVDITRSAGAGPTVPGSVEDDPEPSQGLSQEQVIHAHQVADTFGGGYEVAHSTPIWIIDRQGRIRATMDAEALPSEIVGNIRTLMDR